MIAVPALRTEYPLAIRDKIERLWRMCAFRAPFGSVFQPMFGAATEAALWWLSGGIPAENCSAAWAGKGAASLAASYENLASAATTYDLTAPVTPPDWDAINGWKGSASKYLLTGINDSTIWQPSWSLIFRFSNGSTTNDFFPCGTQKVTIGRNSSKRIYVNGGILNTAAPVTSGTLGIAGTTAYLNGLPDGTIPAGTYANRIIAICAVTLTAGGYFGSTVYVQAGAIWSQTNSDAQMLALHNAMMLI